MRVVQPVRDDEAINNIKKVLREQNERNYLLFSIGINTGMRISDILKLKSKDVLSIKIIIKETKTGKTNTFVLPASLRKECKEYCESLQLDKDGYIFKSRQGYNKPISRQQAYNIINSAAKTIGLSDIGTHSMRKTFGYHLYNMTKNIALIMELLNHDNQSDTLRYIGINDDVKRSALKNFKL